jgi:hypothetical protein
MPHVYGTSRVTGQRHTLPNIEPAISIQPIKTHQTPRHIVDLRFRVIPAALVLFGIHFAVYLLLVAAA